MKKATRKTINRSGKSKCQICNEIAPLQEHHLRGRKIVDPNHPSNLCNICPTCHVKVHEGMIVLEGFFQTTNGLELLWHKDEGENLTGNSINTYIIPNKSN